MFLLYGLTMIMYFVSIPWDRVQGAPPRADLDRVPEDLIISLYDKYREAVDDDRAQESRRRLFTGNGEYGIHVRKLKEVDGFKRHNLLIKREGKDGSLIYFDNPVETQSPNVYLSLSDFKQSLVARIQQQRDELKHINSHVGYHPRWKSMNKNDHPKRHRVGKGHSKMNITNLKPTRTHMPAIKTQLNRPHDKHSISIKNHPKKFNESTTKKRVTKLNRTNKKHLLEVNSKIEHLSTTDPSTSTSTIEKNIVETKDPGTSIVNVVEKNTLETTTLYQNHHQHHPNNVVTNIEKLPNMRAVDNINIVAENTSTTNSNDTALSVNTEITTTDTTTTTKPETTGERTETTEAENSVKDTDSNETAVTHEDEPTTEDNDGTKLTQNDPVQVNVTADNEVTTANDEVEAESTPQSTISTRFILPMYKKYRTSRKTKQTRRTLGRPMVFMS